MISNPFGQPGGSFQNDTSATGPFGQVPANDTGHITFEEDQPAEGDSMFVSDPLPGEQQTAPAFS